MSGTITGLNQGFIAHETLPSGEDGGASGKSIRGDPAAASASDAKLGGRLLQRAGGEALSHASPYLRLRSCTSSVARRLSALCPRTSDRM